MRLAAGRLHALALCALGLLGAVPALLAAETAGPVSPLEIDTRGDIHPHVSEGRGESYIFRNRYLVAALIRTGGAFTSLYLYPATRPTELPSRPFAVAPLLARVDWKEGGAAHTGAFAPTEARTMGDNHLRLTGTVSDGGASWKLEADLSIVDSAWVEWDFRARPSAAVELVRFAPLPLKVGIEGPREALFPGQVFLEGQEPMPGGNGGHHPLVPDPYRITVPFMAQSQAGRTIALMWEPRQGYPAALFDPAAPG
jgi:hypothetical protein